MLYGYRFFRSSCQQYFLWRHMTSCLQRSIDVHNFLQNGYGRQTPNYPDVNWVGLHISVYRYWYVTMSLTKLLMPTYLTRYQRIISFIFISIYNVSGKDKYVCYDILYILANHVLVTNTLILTTLQTTQKLVTAKK